MVLYNWFLWSRVHIQNTHCMAKGCIEIQKRFKLLSDGKRSIISLSTSKVHDSILRKFVFLFFGCRGHTYRSESAGFGKLKGIFIMCIYCMEANKCPNDCFFLVTEKLLLKSLLDAWCWNFNTTEFIVLRYFILKISCLNMGVVSNSKHLILFCKIN